jgi:membrane-bound lytic murein transglycosylase MltF
VRRQLIGIAVCGAVGCVIALSAPCRAATHDHDPALVDLRTLSPADRNRTLAVPLIIQRGWSERQWRCLDRLWTRESHWRHLARNPGSGAYGIPQAKPGRKMSSAGPDWRTNPETQIRWGLDYIDRRYGSPCAAWGHAAAGGWY